MMAKKSFTFPLSNGLNLYALNCFFRGIYQPLTFSATLQSQTSISQLVGKKYMGFSIILASVTLL